MTATDDPAGHAGQTWTGSSARKHADILAAATTVFTRAGYVAASLDEVAELAAVSKRTVYKHFGDKESLFAEVMHEAVAPMQSQVRAVLEGFESSGDLAGDLRALAHALISIVVTPGVMQLRRIVIAESDRFPAIADAWVKDGPARNVATLSDLFATLTAAGSLHCTDPTLAAQHFNWLVLAIPINAAMFARDVAHTPAELAHLADEAVRVFLAAYR